MDSVIAAGKTPYIRWNPRSTTEDWTRRLVNMGAISDDFNPDQDIPDPANLPAAIADADFSMQRVIDGEFDSEFTAWADAAAAHNGPLFVDLCPEMSGFQYSCNGIYNGGSRTDGFGDINEPDGPERFRAAWRHIVDLFRQRGADKVSWVFHVDSIDPDDYMLELQPWNEMAKYYPGDDYVDWEAIKHLWRRNPRDATRLSAMAAGLPHPPAGLHEFLPKPSFPVRLGVCRQCRLFFSQVAQERVTGYALVDDTLCFGFLTGPDEP